MPPRAADGEGRAVLPFVGTCWVGVRRRDLMKWLTGKTLAAFVLVILVVQPVSAETSIVDLGTLGGSFSSASAINDHGRVLGSAPLPPARARRSSGSRAR